MDGYGSVFYETGGKSDKDNVLKIFLGFRNAGLWI